MMIIKSISLFLLAGVCEVGGGYLVWLWLREGKPISYGLFGALVLFGYGIVATFQTSSFGRVYAAYGGFFIALSVLWAYWVDGFRPDKYDIIGAAVALLGVCIIYYTPRG